MEKSTKIPQREQKVERRPVYFIAETSFVPPTDVWETADAVFVLLEIAHLDLTKCAISYENGFLVVKGERLLPEEGATIIKYHKKEIESGQFCVKVKMNTRINPRQIVAKFEAGFLRLRLGKIKSGPREKSVDIPLNE